LITTRFRPNANLILITARIWGPLGETGLRFALDTGATETLVVPDILDGLGYSARDGIKITLVSGVVEEQTGYELPVHRFSALGFELSEFLVNVQDLPPRAGIDGLLGLNFLRGFNYEVRSKEGLIRVEPA
jgi:predicted aspartyl protease